MVPYKYPGYQYRRIVSLEPTNCWIKEMNNHLLKGRSKAKRPSINQAVHGGHVVPWAMDQVIHTTVGHLVPCATGQVIHAVISCVVPWAMDQVIRAMAGRVVPWAMDQATHTMNGHTVPWKKDQVIHTMDGHAVPISKNLADLGRKKESLAEV